MFCTLLVKKPSVYKLYTFESVGVTLTIVTSTRKEQEQINSLFVFSCSVPGPKISCVHRCKVQSGPFVPFTNPIRATKQCLYLVEPQSNAYVTEPQSNAYLTEPQINTYVTEPQSNACYRATKQCYIHYRATKQSLYVTELQQCLYLTEPQSNAYICYRATKQCICYRAISNGYVTEPPSNAYVTEPQSNAYVTEPQSNAYVTEPQSNAYICFSKLLEQAYMATGLLYKLTPKTFWFYCFHVTHVLRHILLFVFVVWRLC